jgi:diaminopimelate epimerase
VGELQFHKYEGLGNDFVLVEAERADRVSPEAARMLCDRRFGIGGDGVLLLLPSRAAASDARMIVLNADGSVPEMCGNGLRCVALHAARRANSETAELTFETDAGPKVCRVDDRDRRGLVTVDMGIIRIGEDVRVDVERPWELTLADAGNPHAILLRPEGFTRADVDRVGAVLSTHPLFPAGTNVEFVSMNSAKEIDLVVWERGVGITHACGTGACATVAVAVAKGWSPVDTEVSVRLPGGLLHVTSLSDGRAIMRGPARHVFSGRVEAPR